jgi:enediyne polyketide synthase
MTPPIAVVGIGCRYPDAATPEELWGNVLAGRRAFRRIPQERMRLEDYWSADPAAPDRFYARHAAVIEGYEFDRVGYKVAGSTYRTTDLTHWLALDTAARALEDAGFPGGEGLPRERTAAIVGNSLTGEFTRANLLRLRWPYVRRVLGSALSELGWEDDRLTVFLQNLEARYKDSFPPVDEDTLAGGLSNTIAGRICNHFDFKGGGFTVDGACSSSLLSVGSACSALASGQIDAALAGGVDLSIDPFEIIGFAKTGALATGEMKVYDQGSNGFWPGEGCGMLVLMRQEDAEARHLRSYAKIAGWGYSSDGKGGMTRPEAAGHQLAIKRAYEVAGFGVDTVSYFEGHGTGTAVGDATELRAISEARREAGARDTAAISTIKGNIGHTKAAAGVAGLIKATMAVHHQVIPPASGHSSPHPELTGDDPALRVPLTAEQWPEDRPVRAGVSAMGFGGINAHVVLASAGRERRAGVDSRTQRIVASRQDHELLLLDAADAAELRGKVARLAELAPRLAFAELSDLAATLQGELGGHTIRAAVVARTPDDAERAFGRMLALLDAGSLGTVDPSKGVFIGSGDDEPRIGYLFPGQGSGKHSDGGALRRRFETVRRLYRLFPPPAGSDIVATAVAQPRIVTSSMAGLRVLSELGVEATAAAGHSLGELTALHWGGAMDERTVFGLAAERGRVMAEASDGDGAMASVAAGPEEVRALLRGQPVVIAGFNGPGQTVISGPADAVERIRARAVERNLTATRISVSHAFHSPAVAPAATGLGAYLQGIPFVPLERRVVSTVTGHALDAEADLRELMVRQVTEPVRFSEALTRVAADADLLIEVGPGRVLSGLAAGIAPDVPVVSLDTDGPSLAGLLSAVAAAYVRGAPVRHELLFAGRFVKPLPLDKEFRFFASPCESAPSDEITGLDAGPVALTGQRGDTIRRSPGEGKESTVDILRRLAAERAELPLDTVSAGSHPLDELHLSSITVGQIMNTAARELGVTAPVVASGYATSTLADLAAVLDEMSVTQLPDDAGAERQPAGIAPWVRAFTVEQMPEAAGPRGPAVPGEWRVFAPAGHPLAGPLRDALHAARTGDGVLLCLSADCGSHHVRLMLEAARAVLAQGTPCRFVAVQDERGAAGLAKTLHLENPSIPVTVVTLPNPSRIPAGQAADIASRIAADVAATSGFSEVRYDADGRRTIPRLRPVTDLADGPLPLGPDDVLLVTGGGKGITAECALALGKESGAAVALLGRSDPEADAELAANLARFDDAGLTYRYIQADVTSSEQVTAAVNQAGLEMGAVTAVLHGAGRNEPSPLDSLTEDAFARTLAPKIKGLEAVLSAVDPASLRLLVTFGSIIGRAGLRGQADYSVANDWLTELTARTSQTHPGCRCVALEWSVWSGAGMGERLGVLESLIREGISPISVEDGIALLRQVLANPALPTALVVMGRAGGLPTIALEPRELPLARFTENPRVHYPGIELVAEAELSAATDPYLADHLLDGDLLFPAVLGMEAMSQVAVALTGSGHAPVLEDIEFLRPIVVPPDGAVTIRIAALITGDTVQTAIRSSETAFQADHFRAAVRFGVATRDTEREAANPTAQPVPLDPMRDLYGGIFFQGPRFHRVLGYRWLAATSCVAEISVRRDDTWFGTFLPQDLVLGDPGARDAFMHAIQCCVPDATLLPAAIERLRVTGHGHAAGQVVMRAEERLHDGDTYVYDLDVRDESGVLVERWEGLRLRAVRKTSGAGPWVPSLLGPYLERHAAELLKDPPRCAVEPDPERVAVGVTERRDRTSGALSRLLGADTVVRHRGDGRPEVASGDVSVSASHNAGVTFAVSGSGRVACDVEPVRERDASEWRALLGTDLFALAELAAREYGEGLSLAATRAWGAAECLRKTGRAVTGAATLGRSRADGWVLLDAGSARIATFVTQLRDETDPAVFSILTEGGG